MSAPNGHAGNSPGKTNGVESAPVAISTEISARLTSGRLEQLIAELAVPFEPSLIEWRVTNTTKDKGRGQVIPYADQRAYTDRLNALVTPAGWTRKYSVHTSANFERSKDQKTVAKILVTCELTIFGLGSHSATGEEWSDDENALTSAEAQAFKRSASCFGLGRYLYHFRGIWVDLDARKRPKSIPKLPLWATPEGWRKGLRRPEDITTNGETYSSEAQAEEIRDTSAQGNSALVPQIEAMARPLGRALYRGILKSVAHVWNPDQIGDKTVEQRVLEHMHAAERGLQRLQTALERVGPGPIAKILASRQLASLDRIASLEDLKEIVSSLESLVSQN
jgi:hypothetical protein